MAAVAGWHNAIKHIDPLIDAFDQFFGRSNSHQITGFILWKKVGGERGDFLHLCGGFADRETADRKAVECLDVSMSGCLDVYETFDIFFTQVGIHPSLHDAKEGGI